MEFPLWVLWVTFVMDFFQQKSHVVCHGTHSLHSLGIESGFAFCAAIDNVPVLRGDHRHIKHLERHEHRLVHRRGSTTTAYSHRCGRLVLPHMRCSLA